MELTVVVVLALLVKMIATHKLVAQVVVLILELVVLEETMYQQIAEVLLLAMAQVVAVVQEEIPQAVLELLV
jgi:hypothetical protein